MEDSVPDPVVPDAFIPSSLVAQLIAGMWKAQMPYKT